MQQDVYDKNFELENRYWWFLGRRFVASKLLEQYFSNQKKIKIIDLGCGSGGNFPLLQNYGEVLGLDIEPLALDFCRSKGFHNTSLMKDYYDTGLFPNSVDLVTMFDVLEHFEDDQKALHEVNRILKQGGSVLITVPALKFLWSEIDDAAHHFRRYKRGELAQKLRENGFEIIKSSYIFFFTFPLVFFYRMIGNLREKSFYPKFNYVEFPKFIAWMLISLSKIEAFLLKFTCLPVGSSVVLLARKIR